MRILHLSADYPDPLMPSKTRAIANLLALGQGPEHVVCSLNRIGWRGGIRALDFADAAGDGHRAIAYGAPPKGLMLQRYLDRLADWIAGDMAARGPFDLIHAHKLSVEGLVAARLAERLGLPVAVTVQGDSDLKIVGVKRALRPVWAALWRDAAHVFPLTPWARDRLDGLLGPRTGPVTCLPCPGARDVRMEPVAAAAPVIRTAFHFQSAGRKNAAALIRAVAAAARTVPEIRLEILGGGDPAAFAGLAALADAVAPGRVAFLGNVPHDRVTGLFNSATGFALVSKRESFGMVYSEALLAGCPCLIPKGWGIDGYFPDGEITLSADAGSEAEITAGLVRLVREEAAFKDRLRARAAAGGLDLLTRPAIRDAWLAGLEGAVRGAGEQGGGERAGTGTG